MALWRNVAKSVNNKIWRLEVRNFFMNIAERIQVKWIERSLSEKLKNFLFSFLHANPFISSIV